MLRAEEQLMHDLRNAASVIRGAASQLQEDVASLPPEVVASLAEMIARRSDVLVRLLEDLTVVHQVDRGDLRICMQAVDLAEIGDYALAELCPAEHATINVEIERGTSVLADPVRLMQVLDNLVTNAVRYGGPHITISASRDGGSVHLDVHDDGPGVPAELRERVFEVYARGPESVRLGGSGLGLAIVRELCSAMGGTVGYDGAQGARFRVTLPAVFAPDRAVDGPGSRGAQAVFWPSSETLLDRVSDYAREGLLAGEAVVVAAQPQHLTDLHAHLEKSGVEVERVLATGQLLPIDADQLRLAVAGADGVHQERFDTLVGETTELVRTRWRDLRVFAEVAAPAWPEPCAMALERFWVALGERESFPLLCGYAVPAGEPGDGPRPGTSDPVPEGVVT